MTGRSLYYSLYYYFHPAPCGTNKHSLKAEIAAPIELSCAASLLATLPNAFKTALYCTIYRQRLNVPALLFSLRCCLGAAPLCPLTSATVRLASEKARATSQLTFVRLRVSTACLHAGPFRVFFCVMLLR